jgi:SAM-dependent MidA family methyltransferase
VGEDALNALLVDAGGWVSFRGFMQAALYHPEHGYYMTGIREVGRRGDFSTAASLHSVLGEAIAGWAVARRRELLPRGRGHLIEVGGGSGQLAKAVLRALGVRGRFALRYHIVDLSEPLRRAQRAMLGGKTVVWHDTIQAALAAAGGQALVFSNELVDAFPCHRLALRDGRWREVGLRWAAGRTVEEEGPLEDARVLTEMCSAPRALGGAGDGQRCEVHLPYRDWLMGWLPGLRRGSVLTIDFGDTVEALYHRRRAGTVRAYFQHVTLEGAAVYGRFGRQDLTADVNFTDLQAWGEAAGLRTRGLSSQEEFIRRWTPDLDRRAETEPALAYLTHPAGPGTAFKVLEQTRRGSSLFF